ncbi:DUF397 domain-containing protein [Nocardia beijingensis]|uniref:DUF397 domain-containing protein n=1 Tax=Nocardia beijingensis TaxID=95162 RepID=A0ABW7WT25_9NOCA
MPSSGVRFHTIPVRVEVAWQEAGHVGVRDSKDPAGPALMFAPGQWDAFAAGVRGGEFDRPA